MSLTPRTRFSPDKPFPVRGVVLPDVFPAPMRAPGDRLDLHDILDGEMPKVTEGQQGLQAQLRIAMGNGPDSDYLSPNMTAPEWERRRGSNRKSTVISVDVEATDVIKRSFIRINNSAFHIPSFNGESFELSDDASEPVTVKPVEQAIAFRGLANIRGQLAPVSGIHFDSCEENGWILLGEEAGPAE